jgi:hypothetical protein
MPSYKPTSTNSAGSTYAKFNKRMGGPNSGGVIAVTLASLETASGGLITPAGRPNSNDWEDAGTWTVPIELTVTDANVTLRVRCVRMDDTESVIQTGAFTATQALTTDRTFMPVAPTWAAAEDQTNLLAIELEFINSLAGESTVSIDVGASIAAVVTDITENVNPTTLIDPVATHGGSAVLGLSSQHAPPENIVSNK